jgi:hypothetical protein
MMARLGARLITGKTDGAHDLFYAIRNQEASGCSKLTSKERGAVMDFTLATMDPAYDQHAIPRYNWREWFDLCAGRGVSR